MNNDLRRLWKEAVVAHFKKLSCRFLEGLRTTTKILSQSSQFPDRVLKRRPYEILYQCSELGHLCGLLLSIRD